MASNAYQPSLFEEGERLKAEGTARVDENEGTAWKLRADKAIAWLAATGHPFTAENVRSMAGNPTRPNAMGARLLAASRAGLIAHEGWTVAERGPRHACALRVWRGSAEFRLT